MEIKQDDTIPTTNSLNPHEVSPSYRSPLDQENASDQDTRDKDKEYNKYTRRIGREFTIYVHPSKDNAFNKVIIPYNFEKKTYWIKRTELEFYENKKYLLDKLEYFNSIPAFNIESTFTAKGCEKFLMYFPSIVLFIVTLYISALLLSFFSFNPVMIYILYSLVKKGYHSLQMFKFILLEKLKMKEINNILLKENSNQFCVEKKLRWSLGQSGYWLEIQKLV